MSLATARKVCALLVDLSLGWRGSDEIKGCSGAWAACGHGQDSVGAIEGDQQFLDRTRLRTVRGKFVVPGGHVCGSLRIVTWSQSGPTALAACWCQGQRRGHPPNLPRKVCGNSAQAARILCARNH